MTQNIGRLLFWITCGALLVAELAVVASPLDLLLFLAMGTVITAPGWPLARSFLGRRREWRGRTVLALVLGYFGRRTAFCVIRLVGLTSPVVILAGCVAVVAVGLACVFRGPQPGVVSFIRLKTRDRVGLGVLWLVALAVVGPVFTSRGVHASRPHAIGPTSSRIFSRT